MAQTYTIQGVLSTTTNDTYIQSTLLTGLTGTDNTAFRIKELLLEHPTVVNGVSTASEMQLSRGTKASMSAWTDTSLILRDKRAVQLTTSGAQFQDCVKDIVPQGDLIIVETQIFLGFKTTGFAALATLGYKLVLEEIKISADQRISILSSRLP